jgi:hypothetical protein
MGVTIWQHLPPRLIHAQLISMQDSQTQDWHADFATGDWPGYYEKCEELEMTPLSVIYSLEG